MPDVSTIDESPVIKALVTHLPSLRYRDYLQDLLTVCDRQTADLHGLSGTMVSPAEPYVGKLIADHDEFLRITEFTPVPDEEDTYSIKVEHTGIPVPEEELLKTTDRFILPSGHVANFMSGEPIETSVGRLIWNYMAFAYPFGDIIPYVNDIWHASDIQRRVSDALIQKRITTTQFNEYAKNIYFLGQAAELNVPNLTEKALTTAPDMDEYRAELWEKDKEAILGGDAVAMANFENALIAKDKEYLKGDASMGFYIKSKSFDVHRKKLYLTHGMVESFGAKGEYKFIPTPLAQGWHTQDFAIICNEIRMGSHGRAMETAKGGEESKFLMRVFQNTRFIGKDCGSVRTLDVVLRKDNAKDYMYRNILVGKSIKTIGADVTPESLVGQTVHLRSPMYCSEPNGFCYTCVGKLMENLDQEAFAMIAVDIGSYFLLLSLKGMHGTKVDTYEIDDLDKFMI